MSFLKKRKNFPWLLDQEYIGGSEAGSELILMVTNTSGVMETG